MTETNKDNIQNLQQSIQTIIHSIEREKINIRINQERLTKKLRQYNDFGLVELSIIIEFLLGGL